MRAFFAKSPMGVYSYTITPETDTTNDVPHAIVVVGYSARPDGSGGYWIAKNSWGEGFADKGFFKVAFGTAGVMEPRYTFGLEWASTDTGIRPHPASAFVVFDGRGDPGAAGACGWYKSVRGDYGSRVARKVGVPVARLLSDNAALFGANPGGFLPPGTRVRVCEPDKCELGQSGGGKH